MVRRPDPTPPEKIRCILDVTGMTCAAAAADIGVTSPCFLSWKNDKGKPDADNLLVVEAWSEKLAVKHGRPDLVIRSAEWASDKARIRAEAQRRARAA